MSATCFKKAGAVAIKTVKCQRKHDRVRKKEHPERLSLSEVKYWRGSPFSAF